MSYNPILSLEAFPVEILHRIFDNLGGQTILSLGSTCRRFQTIVNSYDRFVLNFERISKSDFELVCHLIDPRNVVSLTLAREDETLYQIEFFISKFDTEDFCRVRSLTLIGIEERHLKSLLKYVNINLLISFSLEIEKFDNRCRTSTRKLLLSIIAQANLRRLELKNLWSRIEFLNWPIQCMIQHLTVGARMTFNPCIILQRSPLLKTLVISFSNLTNQIALSNDLPTSFRQLNSLTLENCVTKIQDLELLLSSMPSLTHFKLMATGDFFDGKRWEQFIQTNLLFLNKFEFFIKKTRDIKFTRTDVESIIASFRTSFWVEHKRWFVTCEYNINPARLIKLYSIPVCVSSLRYRSAQKKTSLSTYNSGADNVASSMDNVETLHLNFARVALDDIQDKRETACGPLFRKVKNLKLEFDSDQLPGWTFFTWTLIDLSRIVRIKLESTSIFDAEPLVLADINSLLQRTSNLSSLDLCFSCPYRTSSLTGEDICLMTPFHVRHLTTTIKTMDEIKIVLERLENLSSAKFFVNVKSWKRRLITWLNERTNGSSCRMDDFTVCIWLGRKRIQETETNIGVKRIKLTDEHQNS